MIRLQVHLFLLLLSSCGGGHGSTFFLILQPRSCVRTTNEGWSSFQSPLSASPFSSFEVILPWLPIRRDHRTWIRDGQRVAHIGFRWPEDGSRSNNNNYGRGPPMEGGHDGDMVLIMDGSRLENSVHPEQGGSGLRRWKLEMISC